MFSRAATLLLQIGVVAVALVALPHKVFELDRYFVPKELVLHLVALGCAVLLLVRARTVVVDAADVLLAGFLVWSAASALFATNYWLAQRALGVSVSGAIVFWSARRLSGAGTPRGHRPIILGAAVATVVAAITCLVQAYGFDTEYFSLNRSPGGTFGNRNFVAHFCAIGLSALIYAAITARRSMGALLWTAGAALVVAALVLSRSRAAWLAAAASVAVLSAALFLSRSYWRERVARGRFTQLIGAMLVAATLAMYLPNRLNWRSDSPYLDSAAAMMDYSRGSGRGRVAQYVNSLRMAADNPLFGVGPGNWPVRYVRFVPRGDPSIAADGMTANPWPSSDWAALVSERGTVATVALLGVLASLFIGALRRWREAAGVGTGDAVLAKVVLVGTLTATVVVSLFDAVLMLAAPAFLAWSVLGAASGVGRAGREVTFPPRSWAAIVGAALLVLGASLLRSAGQVAAIETVGAGGSRVAWIRAAAVDPGSYRINLRVAQLYAARGQCAPARTYAREALDLFPYAAAPRAVLNRCR